MPSIDEVFGVPPKYKGLDLYGLELEIEGQHSILENGLKCRGWKSVTDGSLRNGGLEYITAPPLALRAVQDACSRLFSVIPITEESYSDRTSIHVHCNMQGLEVDNLKSLCLLYLVSEKIFFDFVSEERYENVFCVPLMDFTAPFQLFDALENGRVNRVWQKYSALNLLPLHELGTVEFRHMHGTNDVQKIVTWVQAIDCLKQACKKKTFEEWRKQISQLNTSSEYGNFLLEVFGPVEKEFLKNSSFDYYKEALYSNVLRAKLWEMHEKTVVKKLAMKTRAIVEESLSFDLPPAQAVPREEENFYQARLRTGNYVGTYTGVGHTTTGAPEWTTITIEATPNERTLLDLKVNLGLIDTRLMTWRHLRDVRQEIQLRGWDAMVARVQAQADRLRATEARAQNAQANNNF